MGDWVVVLEFSSPAEDRPFNLGAVQGVVERLRVCHPSALFNPERYAIQLQVVADRADEALRIAVAHHERAVQAVGTQSSFTRAEVVTRSEFDQSWQGPSDSPGQAPASPGGPSSLISVEVYHATRALLAASSAAEVREILVHFVLAVGGQVHVGQPRHTPGTTSFDLAVTPGDRIQASAESMSMAGLVLEQWLPRLINDARSTVALLDDED